MPEMHLMDMDMPMLAQAALAHSLAQHPADLSASSGNEASPSRRTGGEAAGCAAPGEWPPSGWPQAHGGEAAGGGSGAHGGSGRRSNEAAGEGTSVRKAERQSACARTRFP
ncbi:unnamed protein product, partial [Closterium sp. NIES-53]